MEDNRHINSIEYMIIKRLNESISKTRHITINNENIPIGVIISKDIYNHIEQSDTVCEDLTNIQSAQSCS